MKKIASFALVCSLAALLLVACGNGGGKSAVAGTWVMTGADLAGTELSAEEANAFGMAFELELKDDGTATGTLLGESFDGSFTENGSVITITFDGESADFNFDSAENLLTYEDSSLQMTIYFER